MLTRESRKWPVQNARGAILVTPQEKRCQAETPGIGSTVKRKSADSGQILLIGSSFLYLITVFVKHAFERIGKSEPNCRARALPVVVQGLVADFKPPVRGVVVMGKHRLPGALPFS